MSLIDNNKNFNEFLTNNNSNYLNNNLYINLNFDLNQNSNNNILFSNENLNEIFFSLNEKF